MTNYSKELNLSVQVIVDAARKKGIKVEIISKRFQLLKLSYKDRSWFIKGTSFPVNPQPACLIANNKYLTKKILSNYGISVPEGWLVGTPKEAKNLIMRKKLFPCVLKPVRGSHGNQVIANIESPEEFKNVLPQVFTGEKHKNVIIEKFIKGKDYRLLVIGNKVSAAMERIPAHVVGDGVSTIRELIKEFNKNPLVGKGYEKPLCKIKINNEVRRNLRKQNRNLSDILRKKEKVSLRQNANISTGGISKDVTDSVASQIKELAVRATKAIGMVIAGVDIIYNETSKKSYVLELNVSSGIDIHHFPILGKPRAVADDIVDFLIKYRAPRSYKSSTEEIVDYLIDKTEKPQKV